MQNTRRSAGRATVRSSGGQQQSIKHATCKALEHVLFDTDLTVLLINQETQIVRSTSAFAHLLGSDPQTIIHKKLADLHPSPELQKAVKSALLDGTASNAEDQPFPFSHQAKDVSRFWTWHIFPVFEGDRKPTCAVIALETSSGEAPSQPHEPITSPAFLDQPQKPANGNIFVDLFGVIQAADPEAEQLFGYSNAELVKLPVQTLIQIDSFEHIFQPAGESLQEKEPYTHTSDESSVWGKSYALWAWRKDAKEILVDVMLTRIQTEIGSQILINVRDAGAKDKLDQELEERTRLLHLIQDIAIASNQATSVTDAMQYTIDRLCAYLNWPVGHFLLALEDENLISTPVWNRDLPEHYQAFRNASDEVNHKTGLGLPGIVVASGQPAWFNSLPDNTRFRRKDIARQAGLQTGLAIPVIAVNEIAGVLEFFHSADIPPDYHLLADLPLIGVQLGRVIERERANQTLRKTAAKLQTVITNLPLSLWIMDKEGHLSMLEGKGVSLADMDSQEWEGRAILEQLTQGPDAAALIRRALNGEEIHVERQVNGGIYYDSYYMPVRGDAGQVEGVAGLSIDITERKKMELQLEELRRRLMESMDIERSRLAQQLHDGPLQDLYGAFYQIQEIKGQLEEPEGEIANEVLQTIKQVNATLRVICGELRPTTLVHLGLQKAIRSHADLIADRIQDTMITLDLADDVVKGEQTLPHRVRLGLFRVYQQLISNAVRHADARQVWVRLNLKPDEVTLEVQDNGKGFEIPKNWIEMVRKGQYGLTTIQERVQGLQGKLEITTNPSQGTLVRVVIPRSENRS